jgi:hypothetical protein
MFILSWRTICWSLSSGIENRFKQVWTWAGKYFDYVRADFIW